MRPLRYVPATEATGVPNVVVDGAALPGTTLTLSHWPGTEAPPETWADTSTEMVQRYVERGEVRHGAAQVVTNDHFDQDGLAGLYVLTDPDGAASRRELLADLARAGDFAVYRDRRAARASMAISAMAADPPAGTYAEQCAALYAEALGRLPELLEHPERARELWEDDDAQLAASEALVARGGVAVRDVDDVDLAVVTVDDAGRSLRGGHRFAGRYAPGLHRMALHALTDRPRLLLDEGGGRYRYGDRYESWVQYRSRPIPRRVDLAPLAAELTSLERDGARWVAGPPGELTPELAVEDGAPSSLPFADVEAAVVRHLRTAPPAWDPFRRR